MKQYRCPWCGRLGMPKYLHFFRFIPKLNLLQHYNWEKCKICGKYYVPEGKKRGYSENIMKRAIKLYMEGVP